MLQRRDICPINRVKVVEMFVCRLLRPYLPPPAFPSSQRFEINIDKARRFEPFFWKCWCSVTVKIGWNEFNGKVMELERLGADKLLLLRNSLIRTSIASLPLKKKNQPMRNVHNGTSNRFPIKSVLLRFHQTSLIGFRRGFWWKCWLTQRFDFIEVRWGY